MKTPIVSAIMPTADRRHLLPLALASFKVQDWPLKELVVVDDGADQVDDLVQAAGLEHVIYQRIGHAKLRIGNKLNTGCMLARGDIMIRWDDDDWYAHNRISDQVNRLLESGKSVSGYHSALFWNQRLQRASKYSGPKTYALGTSLCFRRRYWAENPFPDSSMGEDGEFIKPARHQPTPDSEPDIISVDADQMVVARIHDSNTSNRTGAMFWPEVAISRIPYRFFQDLEELTRAH